jgi:hypothetical protein
LSDEVYYFSKTFSVRGRYTSMRMSKSRVALGLMACCLMLVPVLSCRETSPTTSGVPPTTRILTIPGRTSEPTWNVVELPPSMSPDSTSLTPVIGQVLNIKVEPEPGSTIADGITLGRVTVAVGTMDFQGFNPWGGIRLIPGDTCLLVTGSFTNTSSQGLQISFFAEGFDAKEKQTAWTVDSGPLAGILAATIPVGSSRDFTLHINWTPKTKLVRVSARSYTTLIPLP